MKLGYDRCRQLVPFFITLFVSSLFATVLGQTVDDRTLARSIAATVNGALDSYIVTHNDVFKVSAKRLVPLPGIFEAIDFKSHVATLTKVEDTLNNAGIAARSALDRGVPDAAARQFLVSLEEYRVALSAAVRQFRSISTKLYQKSQDPTNYAWGSYQKDMDAYSDAIDGYMALGSSLNAAYQRIE